MKKKKVVSLDGHETATLLDVIRRQNREREKKIIKKVKSRKKKATKVRSAEV